MVKKDELWEFGVRRSSSYENVSWVGIAVDVAVLKDHLGKGRDEDLGDFLKGLGENRFDLIDFADFVRIVDEIHDEHSFGRERVVNFGNANAVVSSKYLHRASGVFSFMFKV